MDPTSFFFLLHPSCEGGRFASDKEAATRLRLSGAVEAARARFPFSSEDDGKKGRVIIKKLRHYIADLFKKNPAVSISVTQSNLEIISPQWRFFYLFNWHYYNFHYLCSPSVRGESGADVRENAKFFPGCISAGISHRRIFISGINYSGVSLSL